MAKPAKNSTHAFYWRNYEHELHRSWTFPCEADLLAQIYHRLRAGIPAAYVGVEVPPGVGTGRIDLVISYPPKIKIAVEVKMNWDQFKPKFDKERQRKQSEADNILSKFGRFRQGFPDARSILVVIQGVDAGREHHRVPTLETLRRPPLPLELVFFDERRGMPLRERISPVASG